MLLTIACSVSAESSGRKPTNDGTRTAGRLLFTQYPLSVLTIHSLFASLLVRQVVQIAVTPAGLVLTDSGMMPGFVHFSLTITAHLLLFTTDSVLALVTIML